MSVTHIEPYDSFENVCIDAGEILEAGVVLGWDSDNKIHFYAGGTKDGQRLHPKDLLWLLENAKIDLVMRFE